MGYYSTGNMPQGLAVNGEPATYTYDARNRLTAVGGLSYTYNADRARQRGDGADRREVPGAKRRVRKAGALWAADEQDVRTQVTGNGTTITYVTDPHGDLSRVLARTKNGQTTRYVYGVGLLYEIDSSGNATYYHFDQVGNTAALTDESQAVTDRFRYSPYGVPTYREGDHDTPFRFGGYFGIQTDPNGLIHMRARYYNPLIRRFINADPARAGWNWYAYANGNPMAFVDPSGLEATSFTGGGFGGDTITGSTFGGNSIANPFSASEMDFFDANGFFRTGPTVMIRDNFSQHIPTLTSLAIGGPTVIRAGLSKAGSLGRGFMNLMTRTPARNQAARSTISSVDDIMAASSRGIDPVAATGNFVHAGNSASAGFGRQVFARTMKHSFELEAAESTLGFLNGLNGSAPNPMQVNALDFLPNNLLFDPGNSMTNSAQGFGKLLHEFQN